MDLVHRLPEGFANDAVAGAIGTVGHSIEEQKGYRWCSSVPAPEVPPTGSLPAMPADERRIVHLTLADNPDVTTHSIGEGDSRKVVILLRQA